MRQDGIGIVGPLNYDIHYVVDAYPEKGSHTTILSSAVRVGGIGNISGQLSRLDSDIPISLLGTCGTDDKGTYLRNFLESRFPNIDFHRTIPVRESSYTLIFDSLSTKERSFFSTAGVRFPDDPVSVDLEGVECSFLLLEYLLEGGWRDAEDNNVGIVAGSIFRQAQSLGMKTVLDLCSHQKPEAKKICATVFPYVNYLCCNEIEAAIATGKAVPQDDASLMEVLEILRDMGISTQIAIHSPVWNYLYDVRSRQIWKLPSLALPKEMIREKTGAGDAFLSGILYSAWKQWDCKKALVLAVATAASSLAGKDGFETVVPVAEEFHMYERFCGQSYPILLGRR
jgi:sugar/nucleoside kinase (ribokinase family)